jgi:hypothetical protein
MLNKNLLTTITSRFQNRLIIGTALLLLLFLTRLIHFHGLEMHTDEIWSVWQSYGTLQQILRWTPYNWPPLYFVMIAVWKDLVGIHPFVLRLLTALTYMIAITALFRVMWRLRGMRAALLVVLAFSALGFTLRISTEIRGYMLMFAFYLFTFWLTERYFTRPSLRRAFPLAICLAGIFYTYLAGTIGYLMLGLYTIVVFRRAIWRWWLPAVLAFMFALPLLFFRVDEAAERISGDWFLGLFLNEISDYFVRFTVYQYEGYPVAVWIVLIVLSALILVLNRHRLTRHTLAFFLWLVLMPVVMFLLNPIIYLFYLHYSMALMLGIAVWVGWGISFLNRSLFITAAVILIILNSYPFHLHYDLGFDEPFESNFAWLSQNIQWGDVVLIDPGCTRTCEIYDDKKWDYFTGLYFPNGLQYVDQPASYRRIWYITDELNLDPNISAAVSQNRIPGHFVGPAGFLWRLYEAPPDVNGVLFENGMRFHGVDVLDNITGFYESGPTIIRREGEKVRLRLWWSVDEPVSVDYSVATYITGAEGEIRAQFDGPPQVIDPIYPYTSPPPQETSQWLSHQFYIEERTLTLPFPLDIERLQIQLAVYDWRMPNTRFAAPGVNDQNVLPLKSLLVDSW